MGAKFISSKTQYEKTARGSKWDFVFKVHENYISYYDYSIGDNADGLTGSSGTKIYAYKRINDANHYKVFVSAVTAGYETSYFNFKYQTPDKTFRSYDNAVITMQMSWFGVRIAEEVDTDADKWLLSFATGAVCNKGDLLYKNASPLSVGTPDFTEAPFTAASMNALSDADIKLAVKQDISTTIFSVSFLSTDSIHNFAEWKGVNGLFGDSGTSPSETTAGYWKSSSQHVQEDAKEIRTTLYNDITRKALKAPEVSGHQLVWDADKNGGTWVW